MTQCGRVEKLDSGKYAVADQEYSSQNYSLERSFESAGAFEERHLLDRCLMMEMKGDWVQKGGALTLRYSESRNRGSCRDSLPDFARDSAELRIPIRNVERPAPQHWRARIRLRPGCVLGQRRSCDTYTRVSLPPAGLWPR
jgi:hypothetical protein